MGGERIAEQDVPLRAAAFEGPQHHRKTRTVVWTDIWTRIWSGICEPRCHVRRRLSYCDCKRNSHDVERLIKLELDIGYRVKLASLIWGRANLN